MQGRFERKVAVITGGSSGIGLASAAALGAEGADLVICGRDEARLNEASRLLGPETLAVGCDVANVSDLDRLMARTNEKYGGIDILFINAALSEPRGVGQVDEDFFDRMMAINLKGAFFTFARALPLLKESASVIFTGSVASEKGSPSDPVYSASKSGLNALVRNFAGDADVLARRIRVNMVRPGAIRTPLTETICAAPEIAQKVAAMIPMNRWGMAEEVARTVLFLASSESAYITGSTICVDGGLGQL